MKLACVAVDTSNIQMECRICPGLFLVFSFFGSSTQSDLPPGRAPRAILQADNVRRHITLYSRLSTLLSPVRHDASDQYRGIPLVASPQLFSIQPRKAASSN